VHPYQPGSAVGTDRGRSEKGLGHSPRPFGKVGIWWAFAAAISAALGSELRSNSRPGIIRVGPKTAGMTGIEDEKLVDLDHFEPRRDGRSGNNIMDQIERWQKVLQDANKSKEERRRRS
jgi:hypothetical protein